jgi:hypothetical protein
MSPVATTVEQPETTFYWRVKARNDYGWGPLSSIRSFTTPPLIATATIDPATGGTLNTSPGYLIANFPPGAVSQPAELRFNLLATPQKPLGSYQFANRAFTLEAYVGAQRITQFSKPFTMLISYDPNDLLAAGIDDPQELNLLHWDGLTWVSTLPCEGCSIDTSARLVTVVLDHLSEFALAAPTAPGFDHWLFLPVVMRP